MDASTGCYRSGFGVVDRSRLAHPHWPHVFLVPRLMTHLQRRDLGKEADILFNITAGVPFWGARQYEPLTVGILFPPLSRPQLHRTLGGQGN